MSRADQWCKGEAVQLRINGRWRNGAVTRVRQRKLHVELIVAVQEGERTVRHLMDADSPDIRKWGEQ